jgi:hypothetical protein
LVLARNPSTRLIFQQIPEVYSFLPFGEYFEPSRNLLKASRPFAAYFPMRCKQFNLRRSDPCTVPDLILLPLVLAKVAIGLLGAPRDVMPFLAFDALLLCPTI